MKKLTIATAIAAAALFTPIGVGVSVPSTVATAHAYTADEQAYLLTLRDRSSIKGSDDYLIRLGRKVCELKADGYDAAWIVGAATGAFCPEVSA